MQYANAMYNVLHDIDIYIPKYLLLLLLLGTKYVEVLLLLLLFYFYLSRIRATSISLYLYLYYLHSEIRSKYFSSAWSNFFLQYLLIK